MMRGRRFSKKYLIFGILLILLVIPMLIWSFRQVVWKDVLVVMSNFTGLEITIILMLNMIIFYLFSKRWGLILGAMAGSVPWQRLLIYRLVAFGISYFTPGPQVGGEPAQVSLLKQEGLPVDSSLASIYLDRLIDFLVNFLMLFLALLVLLEFGIGESLSLKNISWSMGLFLLLPVVHTVLLKSGKTPISAGIIRFKTRWFPNHLNYQAELIQRAENQIAYFIKYHQGLFIRVIFLAFFTWGLMIVEYVLLLRFMGWELSFQEVITVISAARLAFLTPLPGGLGALEAGQVWVMQILGLPAALGLALALMIRLRDTLFGLVGLFFGSWLWMKPNQCLEVKKL